MTVSAVGSHDNSKLNTIVKSTALGMAGGYALKYVYPIQKQENSINSRALINYCRKITNKAKVKEFLKEGVNSKAKDVFVKMIESNDKTAFNPSSLMKKVKSLGGEESLAGKEFRSIIRNVNEVSSDLSRIFAKGYDFALKYKRPAIPFLVVGAGLGFLAGFAHNVMKTDFDA